MRTLDLRILRGILLLANMLLITTAIGCARPAAQAPALGDAIIKSASVATQSGEFQGPRDSTPDPNATTIYYTATGPHGPTIFSVPATGGAAMELVSGAPLVDPIGIGIGSDGRQLYVADPQAGQIFMLSTSGEVSLTPLPRTAGSMPRGLAVVNQQGQDMIYYTGKDLQDGQAAVFKLPASGATQPTIIAKGAPLTAPDGLAVTRTGVVYVSDRSAAGSGFGRIFKIDAGTVTTLVERVRVGDPAGVALTMDETVLLISALQADQDSDQVLLVNLNTGETGSVTKGISQNQKAGGVHRAHNSNVFSWADLTSGGRGRVYRIEVR